MLLDWEYEGTPFVGPIDDYEGFVYLIENLETNRKYIGKKCFWTRQMDRKKKHRVTRESDWKAYHGSNDELKEDVKNLPYVKFKRTILHLCYYKKQMSFNEEKEQWNRNVLLTDDYYNTNIGGRYFVREKKIFTYRKEKEITTQNDEWRRIKSEQMTGDNNIAKRPDVRAKLSAKKAGEKHHQFGKPITSEHKQALRNGKRNRIAYNDKIFESMIEFKLYLRETEGAQVRHVVSRVRELLASGKAILLSGYLEPRRG
jgi:hypothetical protein